MTFKIFFSKIRALQAYLGTYLKVPLHRSPFMERGELFKDFVVTKIISGRTDGPIQRTHGQPDQFWASIYHLGHSIGLIQAPGSIYEGKHFVMTKIISGRTDGPSQRTHGQHDQFWAPIQPMKALFPLSQLHSIYGRSQRTHGQPGQFWVSIYAMCAIFPLSKLHSIYGRSQGEEGGILDF